MSLLLCPGSGKLAQIDEDGTQFQYEGCVVIVVKGMENRDRGMEIPSLRQGIGGSKKEG